MAPTPAAANNDLYQGTVIETHIIYQISRRSRRKSNGQPIAPWRSEGERDQMAEYRRIRLPNCHLKSNRRAVAAGVGATDAVSGSAVYEDPVGMSRQLVPIFPAFHQMPKRLQIRNRFGRKAGFHM